MSFNVDLHVHSRESGDNNSDPEETIRCAIERELGGIAFTEHNLYHFSEPIEVLREEYGKRILLLRGVEFSCLEGHCLVFGVDTDNLVPRHATIDELIDKVNRAGGAVIPSHPYRGGTSVGDLVKSVKGITAVEGFNGCNMHVFNAKAIAAAEAMKLPFTGGSDAHSPDEVGSCYTAFSERVTDDNFISLLKAGSYVGIDTRRVGRLWPF